MPARGPVTLVAADLSLQPVYVHDGPGWRGHPVHFHQWKRREFVSLLGGAAAWPLAARAQQPMPLVGVLLPGTPEAEMLLLDAFKRGLAQAGFAEGQTVLFEHRWAEGRFDR